MDKHGNVSQLFNKKFQFESCSDIPQTVYEFPKWNVVALQERKIQLNNVKAQLGKFDLEEWSRHTKHNDPSSFVIRFLKQKVDPELVTQAWCKFYECLNQFEIIPNCNQLKNVDIYTSVHLCEAPGAFISALNHFMRSSYENFNWDWFATTLNPYYEGNQLSEMIPDDRLLRYTKEKWYFGLDGTGDLTTYYNSKALIDHIGKKVWLVTADGSVNCMVDPGNQESVVEYLHYCETITALSLLHEGGTFVLKIFTMFESSTICLLYLLNISFQSISAFKPCTSKGGNSEVYIICLGFKGLELINNIWEPLKEPFERGYFDKEVSLFSNVEISDGFLKDIELCADFFMNLQIETINNNIESFRKRSSLYLSLIHHTKVRVANMFLKKYRLKKILPNYKLVPLIDINTCNLRIPNNFVLMKTYKTSDLVHDSLDKIICIKYGKRIDLIGFSYFFTFKDSYSCNVFRKSNQDHYSLYNRVYMDVGDDYLIINRNDFDCYSYSDFQRDFFNFFVCHDLDKDLVMLDIPLATNFLVGFLYILCTVYEEISVHLTGSIVLSKFKSDMRDEFINVIYTLKESYDNIPLNLPFEADMIEIVPINLIMYNNFFHLVYNYNNSLLNKIKL